MYSKYAAIFEKSRLSIWYKYLVVIVNPYADITNIVIVNRALCCFELINMNNFCLRLIFYLRGTAVVN